MTTGKKRATDDYKCLISMGTALTEKVDSIYQSEGFYTRSQFVRHCILMEIGRLEERQLKLFEMRQFIAAQGKNGESK